MGEGRKHLAERNKEKKSYVFKREDEEENPNSSDSIFVCHA